MGCWYVARGATDAMNQREALRQSLVKHEGLRLLPYTDTRGRLTIGVGRNLTDVGISQDEAMLLLEHDIDRTIHLLTVNWPQFVKLDETRQRVVTEMAFNLGVAGLMTFTQMLDAIDKSDWVTAAQEARQSLWANQVGMRAETLATMLETGKDARA